MPSEGLDAISAGVRPVLDERYTARETGLTDSRRSIRASASAIRHLHLGRLDTAAEAMEEARTLLDRARQALTPHPDVLHAGFVDDAAKEYAEARITAALLAGDRLPTHDELGIDPVPFLHGLGEAVGEARRRLLDRLRAGSVDDAEDLLESMNAIVDLLAECDYPDGMTAGLRRTTDSARSLVERSRADLTASVVQERLRRHLEERLGG